MRFLTAGSNGRSKNNCACGGTGKAEDRSGVRTCASSAGLRKFHSQLRSTLGLGLGAIIAAAQYGRNPTNDHYHH
jgi:hypothetical protein